MSSNLLKISISITWVLFSVHRKSIHGGGLRVTLPLLNPYMLYLFPFVWANEQEMGEFISIMGPFSVSNYPNGFHL
jgi:hypothetical protein